MSEESIKRKPTPEELEAILKIYEGYTALKKLGWQEPRYAPRNFVEFEIIELGSTGIHTGVHFGDDKERTSWIDGNWPSRPLLIRKLVK